MKSGGRITPRVRVAHGAATDRGELRAVNEDAVGLDAELGVFLVADGLGGHSAGEVASAITADSFLASLRSAADLADADRESALRRAVSDTHRAVAAATIDRPDRAGMGSTLVAVWVSASAAMWLVNVGDSRCYLQRGGRLEQLSVDDALLESLRRSGLLPDDPAGWPPRSQLTQAVGLGSAVFPHVARHRLQPRDRVLLCSDGLTDMLTDPEISQVLAGAADPQAVCDRLVQEANWRGGLDNITVVVIDVPVEAAGRADPSADA